MTTTVPRALIADVEPAGDDLHVLLVDDNSDDRALVHRALRRDYPAIVLHEPINQAALDLMLEAGDFDLVVTDFQLNWSDGLVVLRAIKERWPHCPVVMFTATGNEEVAVEAMKTGLSDYVLKTRLERLPTSVRLALRSAKEHRALEVAERSRAELYVREQAARAAAEAAVRQRDDFISVAAHELKTPITALRAFAQLGARHLADGGEPSAERIHQVLDQVVQQSDRLTRLVERLLDTSQIESGQLRLARSRVNLVAIAERIVRAAQGASGKHLITLDAPAPVEAEVDAVRIEQLLTNLLDNAVKFSPDGGPIGVGVCTVDVDTVEIAVRDHGIGIAPEHRARIFDQYYQAHADSYQSGMGLGLYVAHQIVKLHGGQIRAEGTPDGGTLVVVSLPSALGG